MMRGTFANVRIKNLMIPPDARRLARGRRRDAVPARRREDVHLRRGDEVHGRGHADDRLRRRGVRHRLERATGRPRARSCSASRRWWRESFERIHRSNLVGMGVLPLQFTAGDSWESLGIKGDESFDVVIGRRPEAAAGRDAGDPLGRRQQPARCSCTLSASTRRSRSTTTSTAASCRSCCGSCWRPDRGWDRAAARRQRGPGSPSVSEPRSRGRRRPGRSRCRRHARCRRATCSPGR